MDEIIVKWRSRVLNNSEEDVIRKYKNEFSITELALEYNVNPDTIRRILIKNNINIRNKKQSRNLSRYNKKRNETVVISFTEEGIRYIVDLYMKGCGVRYIAKSFNVDDCVVVRLLKENNIHIRNREEQLEFIDKTNEIRRSTIIQQYGGYSKIHELHVKSCLDKYGVSNVMHIPKVLYKQQKSSKKIKTKIIEGKKFKYQGYEDKAIEYLITLGYDVDDIETDKDKVPIIDYIFNGEGHKYYPDIFISKDNYIVEVKSDYTMNYDLDCNIAKQKECIKQGYKFDFLIF